MQYTVYKISTAAEWTEILTAFLGEMPFDTFQETDEGLEAFLPTAKDEAQITEYLEGLRQRFPFTYEKEALPERNWNAVWESKFEAVEVPGFCGVRADFHPPFEGLRYEIVIQPKMAFGTGHHATTFMMMQLMEDLDWQGKSLLDYGCGTGILAILAAMMGAADIDAIDIEEAAYQNSLENARRNQQPQIRCHQGTLSDLPHRQYDTILANINRNVILDSLPALYSMLPPGGLLLSSGYMESDKAIMADAFEKHGFWTHKQIQKGDWVATLSYRRH